MKEKRGFRKLLKDQLQDLLIAAVAGIIGACISSAIILVFYCYR